MTVTAFRFEDGWIVDTRAVYHMTFYRKLFDSFREWRDNVKLGDDKKLSVEDSGCLKIKMYNGMVRNLDAWYSRCCKET